MFSRLLAPSNLGVLLKSEHQFPGKINLKEIGIVLFAFHGIGISPGAGGMYEHTDVNHLNKEKVQCPGSYIVSAIAGVKLSFNRIAVGVSVRLPLVQNFAQGQTIMQFRGHGACDFCPVIESLSPNSQNLPRNPVIGSMHPEQSQAK